MNDDTNSKFQERFHAYIKKNLISVMAPGLILFCIVIFVYILAINNSAAWLAIAVIALLIALFYVYHAYKFVQYYNSKN